jgi:hypothetical protein
VMGLKALTGVGHQAADLDAGDHSANQSLQGSLDL